MGGEGQVFHVPRGGDAQRADPSEHEIWSRLRAAGNPVNFVEVDGHSVVIEGENGVIRRFALEKISGGYWAGSVWVVIVSDNGDVYAALNGTTLTITAPGGSFRDSILRDLAIWAYTTARPGLYVPPPPEKQYAIFDADGNRVATAIANFFSYSTAGGWTYLAQVSVAGNIGITGYTVAVRVRRTEEKQNEENVGLLIPFVPFPITKPRTPGSPGKPCNRFGCR